MAVTKEVPLPALGGKVARQRLQRLQVLPHTATPGPDACGPDGNLSHSGL
jgi:hypothetical protein